MDSFDSGFDRWPERRLPLSIVGVKEITNLQWISGLFGLRGFHILELSVVKHTHTHADFVSLPKAPAVPHRLRKKQQQLRVSFICLSRGGKNKGNVTTADGEPREPSQGEDGTAGKKQFCLCHLLELCKQFHAPEKQKIQHSVGRKYFEQLGGSLGQQSNIPQCLAK